MSATPRATRHISLKMQKRSVKYGARFLTRGGKSETPEGKPRSRVVVIEFPTYDAALECYQSPEYAKAMALRKGKSIMDLAITEGYDGPQPTDA